MWDWPANDSRPESPLLSVSHFDFAANTPFTDEQRTNLANNVTYIQTMFPGPNLASPGAAIRDALVREHLLVPGQVLDAPTVWDVFKPAIVMAIVFGVAALVFTAVGIYFCAKVHPALKGFVEKPLRFSRPINWKRHLYPIFILLCTITFVIWSLVCFMDGAVSFSESMKVANAAVDDLITLSGLKVIGILPFGN
jgi:hypothetical protein